VSTPGTHTGQTILLVEDEELLRRLAGRGLARHGYRVLEAATGEEALTILDQHLQDVSIIVTDLMLPGMSGRELADRVKDRCADIKILYTSGFTADAAVHDGVEHATLAFLQKPYTPAALAAKIRLVLDGPSDE
jgi:two-component system, cell cycle sensor histidine kinase and response regulator CckA